MVWALNDIIAFGTLALLAINLLFTVIARTKQASQHDLELRDKKIDKNDRRGQEHEVRLAKVEEAIKHLPTHADVRELREMVGRVEKAIVGHGEQVNAMTNEYGRLDKRLDRIDTYLTKVGGDGS